MTQMRTTIKLDGFEYAVKQGSWFRDWQRSFSSDLVANLIRLNFVDRGPGLRKYKFTVEVANWQTSSLPYQEGVIQDVFTQKTNLENSYAKISTPLAFTDLLNEAPAIAGSVYFTSLRQIVPAYSTISTPRILYDVELTEATQVVA